MKDVRALSMLQGLILWAVLLCIGMPEHASGQRGASDHPTQSVPDTDQIQVVSEAVVLDIVFRDRDGLSVTDLRKEEVQVFEEGVEQEILSLDCRQAAATARISIPSSSEERSPDTPVPADTKLVSIVLHGLSPEGRSLAHRAALDFLGEALPQETYLAVFRIDRTLLPVVGFTNDVELIKESLQLAFGGTYV